MHIGCKCLASETQPQDQNSLKTSADTAMYSIHCMCNFQVFDICTHANTHIIQLKNKIQSEIVYSLNFIAVNRVETRISFRITIPK